LRPRLLKEDLDFHEEAKLRKSGKGYSTGTVPPSGDGENQ
jgi:hypothetical protein